MKLVEAETAEAETAAESSNWHHLRLGRHMMLRSPLPPPLTDGINSGPCIDASHLILLLTPPGLLRQLLSSSFPALFRQLRSRSIVSLQGHRLPSLACAQTPESRLQKEEKT
ncbi:hypothetical protein NC652_008057 [Populus alba x Populus x berolinensis]|nr:hypothetical protein NC652_008057 [Populus alba x Populus x berolinensis]